MENEKVFLNYENIFEYTRNVMEYLMVDKVEVIPGESAEGEKLASTQDWYFKIHFPGNPVMPGVFIMEAIMQTGGFIINTMEGKKELPLLFDNCKSVKISRSVRPGDILKTHVKLLSYRRGIAKFEGEATANNAVICKMEFSLIAPSEMTIMMS